jgi:hypothetical protein
MMGPSKLKPLVRRIKKRVTGDDESDTSEVKAPVSSFSSYAAEGDILEKQGDYRKAIEAYTKVIMRDTGTRFATC